MALCPSVCVSLSVPNRSSIATAKQIQLISGVQASFYPPYTVLKRNSGVSKNKGRAYFRLKLRTKLRT